MKSDSSSLVDLSVYKDSKPCACKECNRYCKRPCWGTPTDMRKIIDAGYGDQLMLDWWLDSKGYIYILCPANPGHAGTRAPELSLMDMFTVTNPLSSGCVFHVKRDCKLHDKQLKPMEGRVIDHTTELPDLHRDIGASWNTDEGRALVEKWCAAHKVARHCECWDEEASDDFSE